MKLRGIAILVAAGALALVGCGDDITNIIEQVPTPVDSPTPAGPTDTPQVSTATPTATPTMDTEEDTPTPISTPTPCEGPGCAVCGNGVVEAPEECDLGGICVGGSNDLAACTSPAACPGGRCTVVGGQPTTGGSCAANCTLETARTGQFGAGTGAGVQALAFAVPVALQGNQTILTGKARDDDTIDINDEVTFRAGDYPAVTKVDGFRLQPAAVTGLVCACVRGIEVPAFGAGNSAAGVISCGGELEGLDYVLTQDHRTDPLAGFNTLPECSHDPDPMCEAETEIVPGVISEACRVGEGDACLTLAQGGTRPNNEAGYCNSAREVEFSGVGPLGSSVLYNNIAIGLLMDRGSCNMGLAGRDPCPEPSYGPDCIPCTDDDADLGIPNNNPTTTGLAKAIVYNAGNTARAAISSGSRTPCTDNSACSESVCEVAEQCLRISATDASLGSECGIRCGGNSCQTQREGRPFDCDALAANATGGLSGGAFVVCFPSISARTIGDNVTCSTFAFQ